MANTTTSTPIMNRVMNDSLLILPPSSGFCICLVSTFILLP